MPPTSSRARGPGSVPPTMTRWRLTEAEKLVLSEIGLGPEQALKKVRAPGQTSSIILRMEFRPIGCDRKLESRWSTVRLVSRCLDILPVNDETFYWDNTCDTRQKSQWPPVPTELIFVPSQLNKFVNLVIFMLLDLGKCYTFI